MKQAFEITVDIQKETNHTDIKFSQNSLNTSELNINIADDGKEFALLDSDKIIVYFKKPDQKVVFQDQQIKILDKAKGKINVLLTTQTLIKAGKVYGDISIEREEGGVKKRVNTYDFSFEVRSSYSAYENIEESANELQILDKVLETGEILKDVNVPALIESEKVATEAKEATVQLSNQIGILSGNKADKTYVDAELSGAVQYTDALKAYPKYYTPLPVQAYDGSVGLNAETVKASDVYALYDGLMAKYPNNIKKTLLGKDQSNTFDIFKYEFNFGNPEEVIILGANIHGAGSDGDPSSVTLGLYEFLKQICDDWKTNDALTLLRYRFKFVVMPIQNPWGYDNKSRLNSRNVDLNRNFDYNWSNSPGSKGTAPFSEKESQYIRDVLQSYPKAIAYYDYHAMMGKNNPFRYVAVTPESGESVDIANDVAMYLSAKNGYNKEVNNVDGINNASGFNYATNVLGIPSANPEFIVYPTDKTPFHSSELMTLLVECYGNFVYRHCLLKTDFKTEEKIDTARGVMLQYTGVATALDDNVGKRLNQFNVLYDTDKTAQLNLSRIAVPKNTRYAKIFIGAGFSCSNNTDTKVKVTISAAKTGTSSVPVLPGTKVTDIKTLNSTASMNVVSLNISSPMISVKEGDFLHFEVQQNGGGTSIKLDQVYTTATFFAVEWIR